VVRSDDISSVLVVQDGRGVIGVDVHQPLPRERFTITHECDHFLLDRDEPPVLTDKQFLGSYFAAYRDSA
jgi:Zn-dependent peptidase ImmA (M78 family)